MAWQSAPVLAATCRWLFAGADVARLFEKSSHGRRRQNCVVKVCVMNSVACRWLSTSCPCQGRLAMDNSLSSTFFGFISAAKPESGAERERFESEHFIEFGPCRLGELRRRHEQIRKKSVSRALALSTAIFVVSGHRRDGQRARRTSQKWRTTRDAALLRVAKLCSSMRVGRSTGKTGICSGS